MFKDPANNVDGLALEADHTLARSQGGTKADRLLIASCNRSRGAGRGARVGSQNEAEYLAERRKYWSREW